MQFWLKKQGIRAAFLDRNSERQLFMRIQSFSGSGSRSESLQVLEHNRQLVSEYFGWPALRLSMGVQVHGNQIDEVVSPGLSEHTDGLVTQIVGVGLAVLVADCSAVLLADRSNRVIAAIHAGWRGALKDILPKAVEKMIRLGAETDLMDAFLSPCISTEYFEVGEEVACLFPPRHVDRSFKRPHVDLQGYLMNQLLQCGIDEKSIFCDHRCTYRLRDSLHSFRRDSMQSGRNLAVIAME